MMPVRELVDAWASVYANSATLRSGISFLHVGALLGGGGSAIAADLGTLKAIRRSPDHFRSELHRLRDAHRIVIASLVIVVLSGILLMAADLDAYLASTAFWLKMALVVGLIANGAVLVLTTAYTEPGDTRLARRVRIVALASLALWFATTLLGTTLPNAL